MLEQITILIVNYNTADFVVNTLKILKKITYNPYKVIIADNNSDISDYIKLHRFCSYWENVRLYRKEGFKLTGSMAHGTTLNELSKEIDTPYFSILDADATWLIKGWDSILINKITDEVKVIGTQASSPKPQGFPLMFCILFESKTFKELNIDFRPKNLDARQDTGFEIREKYLKAGYKGFNLILKNTREYKKGPFKNLIGISEYYFDGNIHIFASHFGRGSSLGKNKYLFRNKKLIYKIPLIGNIFLKRKGDREKQQWIKICEEIIAKY